MRKLKRVLPPIAVVAGILALSQWLSVTGIIRDFVLPAPSSIMESLVRDHALLTPHIFATVRIALLGFLLSIGIGVLLSLWMDEIEMLYRAFYPLIVISQTIPTMVITPVIVLMFGYGLFPRLLVTVLVCFFPICISLLQGLKSVDRDLIRLMRSMGAGKRQILWHVKLPSSLPEFFAGLRISATYAVMAAVLAEWSGGGSGLGVFMMSTKRSYSYDRMFASIFWIVAISLILYFAVVGLEKVSMPWRRKERALTNGLASEGMEDFQDEE